MPLRCALVAQVLASNGFEEIRSPLCGGTLGSTFRRVLIPPWSLNAWVDAGDAIDHLDVELQLGERQVGSIHRVTSQAALGASVPAIVSSLGALVGSETLRCPKCKLGWLTVKQPKFRDPWPPFLSCNHRCWRDGDRGASSTAFPPIVVY